MATRQTKKPQIPAVPSGLNNPQLDRFLSAIKEVVEVGEAKRGLPGDRNVKYRELISGVFAKDGVLHVDALAVDELIVGDELSIKDGKITIEKTIPVTLDDLDDGTTYARVFKTSIEAGKIVLSETTGSLDDLDDGSTYGKFRRTQMSAGVIQLANISGTLDDVDDGATWRKVGATSVSGGKIVLVRDTVNSCDVEEFVNGDYLTNGKYQLSQIYDNGGTLVLSSGTIQLSAADSVVVAAAGGLKVNAAADIQLNTDSSNSDNPSKIIFATGTAGNINMGCRYGAENLTWWPSTAGECKLGFGYNSQGSSPGIRRFQGIYNYVFRKYEIDQGGAYGDASFQLSDGGVTLLADDDFEITADNILLTSSGALSRISSLSMNGALSGVTTLSTSGDVTLGNSTSDLHTVNGYFVFCERAALGSGSNNAKLWSQDLSGLTELRCCDSAGNITTLSPHNFSLFEPADDYFLPWSYYSKNDYAGREINVDMYGAIQALEQLTGKQFIYTKAFEPPRDWDVDQQELVAIRDSEIAEWEDTPEEDRKGERPAEIKPKPKPKYLDKTNQGI